MFNLIANLALVTCVLAATPPEVSDEARTTAEPVIVTTLQMDLETTADHWLVGDSRRTLESL